MRQEIRQNEETHWIIVMVVLSAVRLTRQTILDRKGCSERSPHPVHPRIVRGRFEVEANGYDSSNDERRASPAIRHQRLPRRLHAQPEAALSGYN